MEFLLDAGGPVLTALYARPTVLKRWKDGINGAMSSRNVYRPDRLRSVGDPIGAIDEDPGCLHALLELARRDEEEGLGDAPWPPNFAKQPGKPERVQPALA